MRKKNIGIKKCKTCNKEFEYITTRKVQKTYCSRTCKNKDPELRKSSNENRKKTWENKYGGHPMNLKDVQKKHEHSMQEKYGVSHALQDSLIKSKVRNTKKERYGDEKYNNWQKGINVRIDRYGKAFNNTNYILQRRFLKTQWTDIEILDNILSFSSLENINQKRINVRCKKCGRIWKVYLYNNRIPVCSHCSTKYNSVSKQEQEISTFISQLLPKEKIITGDRSILKGKELDIYIPSKNLAIEYNGIYWHSDQKVDKNYHLRKTQVSNTQGIQLIHILDIQWLKRKELIKSMLKHKLGLNSNRIYARKCKVSPVKSKDKKEFLDKNHLQGNCRSSINIGLYYNDVLVSLLTIGTPRFNKNYDYEILRFANRQDTNVVGGFSKMFTYFTRNYKFNSMLTYVDRDWSVGTIYRLSGFKYSGTTPPNYFYVKNGNLFPRQMFQKHKLKESLPIFDSNLTEYENMLNNGYSRIYNTGNLKFSYHTQLPV